MPKIKSALHQTRHRIARSLDESIDYSLPHIHILGLVGALGFPLFYWIWHSLFPQPYDNIWLTVVGAITALGITRIDLLQKFPPIYLRTFWLFVCTYGLSFFFTFLLLKNDCNMVWSMSTMAGLTLLVLVAHDWILTTLVHLLGSSIAIAAYFVTTGASHLPELYLVQIPVYLFVVVAGGLFNYQTARIRQAKLKALASVGAELAHELRTPLLGIEHNCKSLINRLSEFAGGNQPLQQAAISDEFNESLQHIQRDTAHANTVINMLLMDLGSKNLNEQQSDIFQASTVAEAALERYPFSSPQERHKVSVSVDADFEFLGSDILLMHVLFNLIKNALASIDGEGSIKIILARGNKENTITVRDNGKGIPADKLAYIFDEFFTHGKSGNGTGIGLAFCKKAMNSLGGKIHCESEPGAFTAFTLSLPVLSDSEVKAHNYKLTEKLMDGLRGKKILIIDDEPGSLQRMLSGLHDGALDLSIIDNTHEAILHLKSTPCDLIIMDLSMPGMDGLTSIRVIREGQFFSDEQCENHKTLPILVFSSRPESEGRQASLDAGATDYQQKHADLNGFLASLNQCINSANSQMSAQVGQNILGGKSVLVIDDQKINYISIREKLASSGIRVEYENSGSSALCRLENEDFDCVIMDLHMPGLDGWQTTEAIRSGKPFTSFQRFTKIPVIALSGDPRPELLSRCLQSGFNTLLLKPVDKTLLVDTLAEHLCEVVPSTIETPALKFRSGLVLRDNPENREKYEAEAKLLHDMLTPLLIIETGNQLLKQSISQLVSQYKSSPNFGNQSASLLALESLPSNIEEVIALNRSKAHEFWRIIRESSDSDLIAYLTSDFVREIRILWKNIEISQTICVDCFLPTLVDHYRCCLAQNPPEHALQESDLDDLEELVEDSGRSIEKIKRLLDHYENTKSDTLNNQMTTAPVTD